MIKVENIETWGFEHAIRGMRNPMNSWDKSDSGKGCCRSTNNTEFVLCNQCLMSTNCDSNGFFQLGKNDLDLMRRLYNGGSEHRKYLRQIFISMDITAPLYWWKEFDTYKVGTVSNSCSTMHKIHAKEFDFGDFSTEHLSDDNFLVLQIIINGLNSARNHYLENKDKFWWWQMIQMLPSSYNQKRTITMNYENVMSIINQRTGHKLDEWNTLTDIFMNLPYVKEIRGERNELGTT